MRQGEAHRGIDRRSVLLLRGLFAILAALAVLFAPLSVAEASATVRDHAEMAGQTGDCQMPAGGPTHRDKTPFKICCASTSAAVAMAPVTPALITLGKRRPAAAAIPLLRAAIPAEIATPPPRHS